MDTDIHGPQRMNCNNFGDPPTFPLLPTAGHLSSTLVYDQIPAKLLTLVANVGF